MAKASDSSAAILTDLPSAPKAAATWRAISATCEAGKLTVKVKDGADVTVPPDAKIIINGFPNVAEYVPLWFAEHAKQTAIVAEESKRLIAQGVRPRMVPPIRLTLADTEEGTVCRFDNS